MKFSRVVLIIIFMTVFCQVIGTDIECDEDLEYWKSLIECDGSSAKECNIPLNN